MASLSLFCHGSATVMTDYHMCRYDPVHGLLVCVGDDCDVLVLGKNMCRRRIPVRRGVHWLDCFLYAGTSSILLLSPEGIECVDYQSCTTDTVISAGSGGKLACFHVPQGLTCGAVGRRDGIVSYFRLCDVSETQHQLFWTMKETNVLELAKPFLQEDSWREQCTNSTDDQKFFPFGSLISLDSHPENPNLLIGVIAGVAGVVEWSVGSGRVSTFYNAGGILPDMSQNMLATTKFSPGGNYVVATTTESSHVFVWDMSQKKKEKVSEIYWVVDLSESIAHDTQVNSVEAFQYNEYRVGVYMARTRSGSGSVSDKNSQWFLLLNGQRDIVEVVLHVGDKTVVDQEQVIADLNVYTAKRGAAAKTRSRQNNGVAANFFKVFHVEPCTPNCYWHSKLTDFDLDSLIITSSGGLHPLVVKRKRLTRGLESIQELREIQGAAPWSTLSTVLRLPVPEHEAVMKSAATVSNLSALDELLFGGSNAIDMYGKKMESSVSELSENKRAALSSTVFATVIGWGEAVVLSPDSHQILCPDVNAIKHSSLWEVLADQHSSILLETALPSSHTSFPSEVVVRVVVSPDQVVVSKYTIRLGVGGTLLALDRAAFGLPGGTGPMATKATIAEARISSHDREIHFAPEGQCLVLLLENSSIALVDLSGVMDRTNREPVKLLLPCGSFLPAGCKICDVETFWGTSPPLLEESLYLVALLHEGKGIAVWNMKTMQMYHYPQFSVPATRLLIADAVSPGAPNMSGDVQMFSVDVSILLPPTQPGECGSVTLSDAGGGVLHRLQIGFGMTQAASREWCIRTSKDSPEVWHRTGFPLDVKRLVLSCTLTEGRVMHWKYASDFGGEFTDDNQGLLKGTISAVTAFWPIGKASLFTQIDTDSVPKRQVLCEGVQPKKLESSSPVIIMVGRNHLSAVAICETLSGSQRGAEGDSVPTIRLDESRSLEDVSLCHASQAIIVLTRDENGWRWIHIMDCRTLKSCMTPLATLDFVGEENLKILRVNGKSDVLHLYLVGATNGAIGHYVVSTKEQEIMTPASADPFWPKQYEPAPGAFRRYHRYLPRRPTQKAESNFFKRLMSTPWEDVAEELVGNTFKQVKRSEESSSTVKASDESSPTVKGSEESSLTEKKFQTVTQEKHIDATDTRAIAPPSGVIAAAALPASVSSPPKPNDQRNARRAPPAAPVSSDQPTPAPGSRYAQLKAIAQRENVSLTEARRMMGENVRKLQERAERLGAVADKSEELASRAMTFHDLARQLKEKQRNSWL